MEFIDPSEMERRLANLEEAVKYLPEYVLRQNDLEERMNSLEKLLNKAVINMMPKLDEVLTKLSQESELMNRINTSGTTIPSSTSLPSTGRNISDSVPNSNSTNSSQVNSSPYFTYPVIYPPLITTPISSDRDISTNQSVIPVPNRSNSNFVITSESPIYSTVRLVPRNQTSGIPTLRVPDTSVARETPSDVTSSLSESNSVVDSPTVEATQTRSLSEGVEESSNETVQSSEAAPVSLIEENSSSDMSQSTNIVSASSSDASVFTNEQSLNYASVMFTSGNNVSSNTAAPLVNYPGSLQASTNTASTSMDDSLEINEANNYPILNDASTISGEVNLRYPHASQSNPNASLIPVPSRSSLPCATYSTPSRRSLPTQPFLPTAPSNLSLLPTPETGQPLSPLLAAAASGEAALLRSMLSSQSSRRTSSSVEERDPHGDTALHLAAGAGHVDALLVLLAAWANSNARGRRLRTPLHCAAAGGHAPAVRRLLRAGANPSLEDADGATALALAATQGHVDALSALLHKGATASGRDKKGRTPAVRAASSGHSEVVVALLQSGGVDPDECDAQGHPLVVHAARGKHWDVVRLLMQNGASSTTCKSPEESALTLATQDGQIDIVREILQQGASAEAAQVRKALAVAKTPAVVWAFVDAAPDALRGDAGRLALLSAAVDGRLEVLAALLEAGVDIGGCADESGETQVEALLALLAADENSLRRKEKKGGLRSLFGKHSSKHPKK